MRKDRSFFRPIKVDAYTLLFRTMSRLCCPVRKQTGHASYTTPREKVWHFAKGQVFSYPFILRFSPGFTGTSPIFTVFHVIMSSQIGNSSAFLDFAQFFQILLNLTGFQRVLGSTKTRIFAKGVPLGISQIWTKNPDPPSHIIRPGMGLTSSGLSSRPRQPSTVFPRTLTYSAFPR